MECLLDKDEFAKAYKKFYFALHPEKKKELNEVKRRSNLTNKEKLEEDLKEVCKIV